LLLVNKLLKVLIIFSKCSNIKPDFESDINNNYYGSITMKLLIGSFFDLETLGLTRMYWRIANIALWVSITDRQFYIEKVSR